MHIFLSYPRKDIGKARKLKKAFLNGGHSVWMDDQLIIGQPWREQLEAEIKQADAFAMALTPNWLASPYCNWEFITAVENGKKVIPVLLEKTTLPDRISKYQYADLSDGFDKSKVDKLLNDLVILVQTVEPSDISDMDKGYYAMEIDQNNKGDGHNISVSGSSNTVAGGNVDQSHQNISIGGNVSGGNINIGGKQTFHGNVNIQHSALSSAPAGSPLDELKALLQELETVLKQAPVDKAEDVEAIQTLANQAIAEVEKDEPNKTMLKITREGLLAAAENLLAVSPIVAKIAQKLLMIR